MQTTGLAGRCVLIVEDEPLVALDIIQAFEAAGAQVKAARTLAEAKCFVERDGLSAAVLDFGLGDGDADWLCGRLTQRNIPFVLHSGYGHVGEACRSGIVIPKPANPTTLVGALVKALEA
jgi:DNA-binding NtrC family response regulator